MKKGSYKTPLLDALMKRVEARRKKEALSYADFAELFGIEGRASAQQYLARRSDPKGELLLRFQTWAHGGRARKLEEAK